MPLAVPVRSALGAAPAPEQVVEAIATITGTLAGLAEAERRRGSPLPRGTGAPRSGIAGPTICCAVVGVDIDRCPRQRRSRSLRDDRVRVRVGVAESASMNLMLPRAHRSQCRMVNAAWNAAYDVAGASGAIGIGSVVTARAAPLPSWLPRCSCWRSSRWPCGLAVPTLLAVWPPWLLSAEHGAAGSGSP